MDYLNQFGITKLHSTPYYAQENSQVKATNKIIVKGISKLIDNNPGKWDEILQYALWDNGTSKREATRFTPFNLVYRQTLVIPAEVNVRPSRVAHNWDYEKTTIHKQFILRLWMLYKLRKTLCQNENLKIKGC